MHSPLYSPMRDQIPIFSQHIQIILVIRLHKQPAVFDYVDVVQFSLMDFFLIGSIELPYD